MDNSSCGPKQSRTRQRYRPHSGTPQVDTNERTKLPGSFTRSERHTDRHHGTSRQGHLNVWAQGAAISRHHRQRIRNSSRDLKGRGRDTADIHQRDSLSPASTGQPRDNGNLLQRDARPPATNGVGGPATHASNMAGYTVSAAQAQTPQAQQDGKQPPRGRADTS